MTSHLEPLHDKVLVRPIEFERTTKGGLIIPDSAVEKTQRGEVIAVGPGRFDPDGRRVPMGVEVGDEVVYARYGGSEIKIEAETLLVLSERDIYLRLADA